MVSFGIGKSRESFDSFCFGIVSKETRLKTHPDAQQNRTIDWQKKTIARTAMRKMVKHLLKKYKYSPEDYDTVISTVIS